MESYPGTDSSVAEWEEGAMVSMARQSFFFLKETLGFILTNP